MHDFDNAGGASDSFSTSLHILLKSLPECLERGEGEKSSLNELKSASLLFLLYSNCLYSLAGKAAIESISFASSVSPAVLGLGFLANDLKSM